MGCIGKGVGELVKGLGGAGRMGIKPLTFLEVES
jgi:hypothetical protein